MRSARRRQRGQVLAIFAVATIVFVGILAVVVDVSWYWASSLRVQRAADAASLAGVVWLPGDVTRGVAAADAAAAQNGYATGVGVTISANQDSQVTTGGNPNQMDVTISAPVNTFFMRMFGITKIQSTRTSHAVYVLPVPMGSPQNYFGDFGKVRTPGGGTTQAGPTQHVGPFAPTAPTSTQSGGWTNPQNAFATETPAPKYAVITETRRSTTDQAWTKFNIAGLPGSAVIDGIQVDVMIHATSPSCSVSADLSWNNGNSWTNANESIGGIPATDTGAQFGGPSDDWSTTHTWSPADFSNGNFVARLSDDGGSNCDSTSGSRNHTISLDRIQATVFYHTTTFVADSNLTSPTGGAMTPQGFWGTIMSQGGETLNGDIYAPKYDNSTGPIVNSAYYDPNTYYQYQIQMPVGGSNGQVWLYDAPFCASDGGGQYGTGDRWLDGDSNSPISTFYSLYDTKNTQDTSDDTLVWSSNNLFAQSKGYSDNDLYANQNPPHQQIGTPCDLGATATAFTSAHSDSQCDASLSSGIDCHLRWYQLPVTLSSAKLYRLHVTTTGATSQTGSDGHNSFTIWSTAAGGTPRVYGVGAMETFEPLPGGASSIFYLAQIGAEHAGKTMEINLWDPGDTSPLPASLKILARTSTGYVATNFSWSGKRVNSQGQSCTGHGGPVTWVTTNVGNTIGTFNGCWLTIDVALPVNYTAATPPGETNGGGWWKIEYDMGGSSSIDAYDLTTWQVNLLGNPVHLVTP